MTIKYGILRVSVPPKISFFSPLPSCHLNNEVLKNKVVSCYTFLDLDQRFQKWAPAPPTLCGRWKGPEGDEGTRVRGVEEKGATGREGGLGKTKHKTGGSSTFLLSTSEPDVEKLVSLQETRPSRKKLRK